MTHTNTPDPTRISAVLSKIEQAARDRRAGEHDLERITELLTALDGEQSIAATVRKFEHWLDNLDAPQVQA